MNLKDIYIQFAAELKRTELLDEFDTDTGIAVMKLPITQRQAAGAVKSACEWLLKQEEILHPFLYEARRHKAMADTPLLVAVRCMTPAEMQHGITTVSVDIPEAALTGKLQVLLYSHTVIDVFAVVEAILQNTNPAIVESILYDID